MIKGPQSHSNLESKNGNLGFGMNLMRKNFNLRIIVVLGIHTEECKTKMYLLKLRLAVRYWV